MVKKIESCVQFKKLKLLYLVYIGNSVTELRACFEVCINGNVILVRFEALVNVMSYSLIEVYQRFRGMYYLHL
jgi:hypothetical protein